MVEKRDIPVDVDNGISEGAYTIYVIVHYVLAVVVFFKASDQVYGVLFLATGTIWAATQHIVREIRRAKR